ncbi:MAG: carbohydrate kinase family protein [Chloroflexaceae bacterium]|jgi:ribokinase|nr:carbohydrate kinase family protein [Chloroflexaceae bacterium]
MVIVIGDINVDVMMAVSHMPCEGGDALAHTVTWSNGGTGLNAATAVARMGGAVRLWGRIGTDAAANQITEFTTGVRIQMHDIQHDAQIATGLCVIPVTSSGERTFLSFRGANQYWQLPTQWPTPAGWLMVCGHALLSDPQRQSSISALRHAQQQGWHTVIDVCEPLTPQFDGIMAQLPHALTLLCGNDAEMQVLAKFPVASYAQYCITKRGAAGATAVSASQTWHAPGFVVDAIDTTACGDTFVAVCCYALARGATLADALTVANAAGALTARRRGAADIVPTRAEVCALLHQHAIALPDWLDDHTVTPPTQ